MNNAFSTSTVCSNHSSRYHVNSHFPKFLHAAAASSSPGGLLALARSSYAGTLTIPPVTGSCVPRPVRNESTSRAHWRPSLMPLKDISYLYVYQAPWCYLPNDQRLATSAVTSSEHAGQVGVVVSRRGLDVLAAIALDNVGEHALLRT